MSNSQTIIQSIHQYLSNNGYPISAATLQSEGKLKKKFEGPNEDLLSLYSNYGSSLLISSKRQRVELNEKLKEDSDSSSDSSSSDSSEDSSDDSSVESGSSSNSSSSDSSSDSSSSSESSDSDNDSDDGSGSSESSDSSDSSSDDSSDSSSSDGSDSSDSDSSSDDSSDSSSSESSDSDEESVDHVKKRMEDMKRKADEAKIAAENWAKSISPPTSAVKKDKGPRKSGEAFRRVDAEVWNQEIIQGLADNSYENTFGEEGYGFKAHKVLSTVRGKDFRHEKTKRKRGNYRGGNISLESKSFKYDEN